MFMTMTWGLAGWVAAKRRLFLRGLLWPLSAAFWFYMESCREYDNCSMSQWKLDIEYITVLWVCVSVTTLYAHYRYQLEELFYLIACMGVIVGVRLAFTSDSFLLRANIVFFMTFFVCVLTWHFRGFPGNKPAWTITGSILALVSVCLMVTTVFSPHDLIQAMTYLSGALAAFCLAYTLRDPELHPNYHFMSDVL